MKVAILAGGLGTRLQEETVVRPKPMVEIGGRPILWHIMKHFSHYEFNDFYIAAGHLGNQIKQYFLDCLYLSGHITIDFKAKSVERDHIDAEQWLVNVIDTGPQTNTGGRLKRLRSRLGDEPFLLTYGDGVSNVNLLELVDFHQRSGRMVTVTAVRPPARFGGLQLNGDIVENFTEKPVIGEGWINGGYMVCEPSLFDFLTNDGTSLEHHALEAIADAGQLAAFRHDGFWQCMDTLRDKTYLQNLWDSEQAPWNVWSGESMTRKD
ncbi:MAG: glucose-1-phosphate cytidylyltransferase [Planctomycetaceae bacterium]|nr:glucose-1-phosphate cytidylyltransferase [Planctomycetales bacterium]MCB9873607.1 glucose-1-phosphate cytidylyltransferase [Planctomycetaceae bacterium]MCB9940157.1 glucose-1-phosphate cytidylyltransferase [Planctomycetaceae bacterium]